MAEVLLVVDLQKEFMDHEGKYKEILEFVRNARDNGYDAIYATMCVNQENGPYVRYGRWHDCMGAVEPLEFTPDKLLIKHGFGLDNYGVLDKDNHYTIVGFNTDACVLKVATDLFDRNYNFNVKLGYCYSSNGFDKHNRGVSIFNDLMPDALS